MVVIAASRRSRRRSSPLRGGHGGGLCPVVAIMTEVFLHQHKNNAKKLLHMQLPPFFRRNLLWVCASSRHLRRQAHFSTKIEENNQNKQKEVTSTGRGRWSCGGIRRAAVEITAVFGGHVRWSRRSRAEADADLAVKTPKPLIIYIGRWRAQKKLEVHKKQIRRLRSRAELSTGTRGFGSHVITVSTAPNPALSFPNDQMATVRRANVFRVRAHGQ